MNKKVGAYQVIDFPLERRAMPAFLELKASSHRMYALLEVDVTFARQFIEEYKMRTGEQMSFTGYLAFCLARAVDENKTVQACRKGSKQLIIFDDVDVGFMIERKQGETPVLTGYVMRGANHKTSRRFTRRFALSNQNPCHPIMACPPGFAPPCYFRGLYQGCSRLCL
jgi:hypothetical protein